MCLTTILFGQITLRQTNCLPEGYCIWLIAYITKIIHTASAYVCVIGWRSILHISFKITFLAMGQLYDCASANEAALEHIGRYIRGVVWLMYAMELKRNVKLAGYLILDIGHSNGQCPISNIQQISRSTPNNYAHDLPTVFCCVLCSASLLHQYLDVSHVGSKLHLWNMKIHTHFIVMYWPSVFITLT